jgi:alkylresorcinol/alkylpyrone synthase
MFIVGTGTALPNNQYSQEVLTSALADYWGDNIQNTEPLYRLHSRVAVSNRHLAFPIQKYYEFDTWGQKNSAWLEVSEILGEKAIDAAIARAGIERIDIDALVIVSVTGIASPSLDARLINRMGLREDIKRTPIFGVGCVGGALGLTRVADYVKAYPNQNAVLLAVELCSLTLMRDDVTIVNLIATGLFGDGAAAVVVSGQDARPIKANNAITKIEATGSYFYKNTEKIMGWDISEAGFKIVLSQQLMELIKDNLAKNVDHFLAKYSLSRKDISHWLLHTGGPHVLNAMTEALNLDKNDVQRSWDSLDKIGNLSSASILFVLDDFVLNVKPVPGSYGILLAMGPGFCSEMLLLKW